MEILKRFQKFLNGAVLQDQTALINAVLKDGNSGRYITSVRNRDQYSVTLSDGELVGSEVLIKDLQIVRKEELTTLTRKIILANDHDTIYSLLLQKKVIEDDLKILYQASSKEKQICQWLLVPSWLENELLNYGEVVLKAFNCCFWGTGYPIKGNMDRDAVLLEIFEELNL